MTSQKIHMTSIGVFLPSYNEQEYLSISLPKMLAQSDCIDDLYIVDDASTDDSQKIIRQLTQDAGSNVHVILKSENKGLFDSHKVFNSLVTTDYIYSSAPDDWVLPGFFEKCKQALAQYPGIGFCCTDRFFYSNQEGRYYDQRLPLDPVPQYVSPERFKELIWQKNEFIFPSNSVVVNRQLLNQMGGFPKELEWHADWFAYNTLALRAGFYYIPEPLVVCRYRKESYSAVGMSKRKEQAQVFKNFLNFLYKPEFEDIKHHLAAPALLPTTPQSRILFFTLAFWRPRFWQFLSWKTIRAVFHDIVGHRLFDFLWKLVSSLGAKDLGCIKLKLLKLYGAEIDGTPRIEPNVLIQKPYNLYLGDGCQIHQGTHLKADLTIKIGAYTIIQAGCKLLTTYWETNQSRQVCHKGPIEIGKFNILPVNSIIQGQCHLPDQSPQI